MCFMFVFDILLNLIALIAVHGYCKYNPLLIFWRRFHNKLWKKSAQLQYETLEPPYYTKYAAADMLKTTV